MPPAFNQIFILSALVDLLWHVNCGMNRMAKKIIQPGQLQNADGDTAATQRRALPPVNSLYFVQPRPMSPPKSLPVRRRLEITIDPESQRQVNLPIKFLGGD